MRNLFVLSVILLMGVNVVHSQSNSKYVTLRDDGISFLKKGLFADAKFKFKGAEMFASESEKKEILKLQNTLQDSVNAVYNAAYKLMGKKDEKAVMMFERLFDKSGRPMTGGLYAQMGWSYGKLKMKEKQRTLYEKGLKEGEALAAYYLATLMQENKERISTDSLLSLYKRAAYLNAAVDSIAIIYYRNSQYNMSYSWFTKSSTIFSKYWRASILLDPAKINKIDTIFLSDDPIKLLSEAACADNLSLAKEENCDALFYLGELYYFAEPGDRVKRDRDKGRSLILKAKVLGHLEAKRLWLKL